MPSFKHSILFISIVCLLLPIRTAGQANDYAKYKADSLTMEAYADSLFLHLTQPNAIKMADTLFDMAKKLNLPRRQSLALSYKVDYYYSNRIRDSLFMAVDAVQKFCKANNLPIHYYFSWTRKINYYTVTNKLNSAINEINLMLDDAYKANYLPAQINGYSLIGRIYNKKYLFKEAYESYMAAIKMSESAPEDVEIPNRDYLYLACAQTLPRQGRANEMIPLLDKALSYTNQPSRMATIYSMYSLCYCYLNNFERAEYYINLAKETFPIQNRVGGLISLLNIEIELAISKGDGHRAIALIDSLTRSGTPLSSLLIHCPKSYMLIGDYKKAYEYTQKYIMTRDSATILDTRNDISELIVLTDVNRIKTEKAKKELDLRNQKLFYLRIFLAAVISGLLVISLILYKYSAINRKLAKSKKNLTEVQTKLEQESAAKTEFIHQLSHEIRTPLNALSGFSDLLIASNPPSEKNNEYGKVIQASSEMIIKFFTDAIDIANSSGIGKIANVDVNSCFDAALEYPPVIKPAKGVALKFNPYVGESCIFPINYEMVARILYNLIQNSVGFTQQGHIIVSVDVDVASRTISYTVSDTGVGIPKNLHDYVFEYFTKIDSNSPGVGLGLSLSRYLAELMGGSLTIDSNYTNSCRFVLKFPY